MINMNLKDLIAFALTTVLIKVILPPVTFT